jgi:rare lipoprotein A
MKKIFLLALLLAGCSSAPQQPQTQSSAPESRPPPPTKGGYYKDDGPGDKVPPNLASIPDAVPRSEPLHRYANRPYRVFDRQYVPIAASQPYREQGTASWYGKKFHGQRTSSGEVYDMYQMSAAHKTRPIPSYARVTNLANGRSVVVRVNDRGPFHSDRIIDLSYAAASKLGYIAAGSARVEVESVTPAQAAAAPVVTAPAEESKSAVVETGTTYIQVGAFSSRENAEDLRGRIVRQLSWLTDAVQVLSIGNLWRLHVGPYKSNDDARTIAQRIEAELNLKPLLVVR